MREIWGIALALSSWGCPTNGARDAIVGIDADTCVPGTTVTCACPGELRGVQTCREDGRAFGSCTGCSESARGTDDAAPMAAPRGSAEKDPCDYAVKDAAVATPAAPPPLPAAVGSAYVRHGHLPYASPTAMAVSPPVPPMPCETSFECKAYGSCTNTSFGCRIASNDDCRRSRECRTSGYCTYTHDGYHNHHCHACESKDCRASDGCRLFGACSQRRGHCVAAKDADCQRSEVCKQHGLCKLYDKACIAKTDQDCKRSEACKQHGYCRAAGATCAR